MLSFGEDWVLGLSRDLESIDGPARVEGAMAREAAAVCRSRAGRAIDAIVLQTYRRVANSVDGRMQDRWGVAVTARSKSKSVSQSQFEVGVWSMSLPSSRGEADLVFSAP